MADMNFGLLQGVPLPTPGQTVYQLPVHPQSGLDSLLGGVSQGMQQGQQMALQRSQLALEQQKNAIAQQLAPSQIAVANAQAQQAQMAVQVQQQQLQRQSALMALAQQNQQPVQDNQIPPSNAPNASPMAQSSGMASAPDQSSAQQAPNQPPQGDYNSSVVNYYKQIGRPDLAMAMLKSQQDLMDATIKNQKALQEMTSNEAKNKWEQFEHAGSIAFGLTQVPDAQAIQLYNSQYGKVINKIDPNSPKPGSNPDETLAYLHGAVAAYSNVRNAIASNPALAAKIVPTKEGQAEFTQTATEAKTPTETAKAQDLVMQRQQELDSIVKSKGANSKDAKDAQARLDEAQEAVGKVTSKGGLLEGITKPIGKAVSGVISGIGNRFAPAQQQTKTYTYNPKTGKLE